MSKPATVGFVSLGCPKALVDSERILTQLRTDGYQIAPSYDGADVVVVNTCGFIDDAIAESLEAIEEALTENGKVIVTGCLGAKDPNLMQRFPKLLAVTGPHAKREVMQAIHAVSPPAHDPHLDLLPLGGIKLTPRHYAYLKISEGCNHRCTFCIIPDLRGDLVSRPVGSVLQEAEALVSAGVRELLVVSQDTSAYGVDVKYRPELLGTKMVRNHIQDLAQELGQLDAWVRMYYIYPYPHVDALIPLMADGLILPYLDIPFQHASQSVLKAMKRPAHAEKVLSRIEKWREICPDITLRSTFIVGFPGETEEQFQQTLDLLSELRLDKVHCAAYSTRPGTIASRTMNDAVPEAEKTSRRQRVDRLQEEIQTEINARLVGRYEEILVEGRQRGKWQGRTRSHKLVFFEDEASHQGELLTVKIARSSPWSLQGSSAVEAKLLNPRSDA
ncbi:MAG: 30S ribosomal protein S12 methylthiotransferase RimO [Alcanivorax sp.]|nr:30S ribosomal protein S12 methylthiotransferase RimO [Alcanivorax sp.]